MVIFQPIFRFIGIWDQCEKQRPDTCRQIDRKTCDCNCFDGYSKAMYSRGGYKYIYYNAEWQTFFIFSIIVFYILTFYRSIYYILQLFFSAKLNLIVFGVWCSTIYSNYYGAGMFYNYLNDEIYHLFKHQLYFSATEFLNSLLLIQFIDKLENPYRYWTDLKQKSKRDEESQKMEREDYKKQALYFALPIWFIFYVSITHIIQAALDQGMLSGISFSSRSTFLIFRDFAFFLSDGPSLLFAFYCLSFRRNLTLIFSNKEELENTAEEEEYKLFKLMLPATLFGSFLTIFVLSFITFGG